MGVTNAWLSGSSSSVAKTGDTMTGNLSWSGTTIAGIRLNNLTTTQQNALTGAAGQTIWNTTLSAITTYDGSAWQQQAVLGLAQSFTAQQTFDMGTITASKPLTYSATWNNAGVSFDGLLVDITNTASASTSYLFRGRVDGSDKFSVDKAGAVLGASSANFTGALSSGTSVYATGAGLDRSGTANGLISQAAAPIMWSSTSSLTGTPDIFLYRDAANTLALRNGGTAVSPVVQTFNVYNFWAASNDHERGYFKFASNVLRIGTDAGQGTGTTRNLQFDVGGASVLDYGVSNANKWTFGGNPGIAVGNLAIGYASINFGDWNGYYGWVSASKIRLGASALADGNITVTNSAGTGFGLFRFGGDTTSFPALKRSATDLQVRLADDSGYAGLQLGATSAALKVGTLAAIVAETITGYITIKDSGGTDRKIAVVS